MLLAVCGPRGAGRRAVVSLLRDHTDIDEVQYLSSVFDQAWTPEAKHAVVSPDVDQWAVARKRPFAICLFLDAPLGLRYRRVGKGSCSLAEFVEQDELESVQVERWREMADLHMTNAYESIDELWHAISKLQLLHPDHRRPAWDTYFIRMAILAGSRTNCMKRRVGAILVLTNRVVSTGYNGTPSGVTNCNAGGCIRCNGFASAGVALEDCLCLHAEENALLEAGRERAKGSTLYTSVFPCLSCTKKIIQCGVARVVYSMPFAIKDEVKCRKLLLDAEIEVDRHSALPRVLT